jgi:acyl carrier protein
LEAQENNAAPAAVEAMVQQLIGLMEREIEGAAPSPDDVGSESITRLNLDSLALIGFLVAVEDEFEIEWDPDVAIEVLRSFEAMARYVLSKGAGSP